MITVALENLQIWFVHTKLAYTYPEIQLFFWPFETLSTPLFFLFVIYYLGKEKYYKFYKWFMYIPMIIFWPAYLIIKTDLLFFEGTSLDFARYEVRLFRIEELLAVIFTIINGFFTYKVILDFEKENANKSYEQVTAQTLWLKRILYFTFALCVLWGLTYILVVYGTLNFGTKLYIPSYIGFSLLIIWLGYSGFFQARVLSERKRLRNFISESLITKKVVERKAYSIREADSKTDGHFTAILAMMEEEEIFLNPSLDLNLVAERLDISPNYVSKIINMNSDTNFSEFVNNYRIEMAQQMLSSKEFKAYTVLSIALEAGFNSRTAFYTSFKKQTGLTPSEFKAQFLHK